MKKRLISFLAAGSISFAGFSQQVGNEQIYRGVLITKQKGTPVEYANIGIVEKNIGTTSYMDGRFELKIPSEFLRDSIRFSTIGYETITLVVSDFINRVNDTIWMAEKTYSLREVVISPSKSAILGNLRMENSKNRMYMALNGRKGCEVGITLDPKKGNQALLETLILYGVVIKDEIYDENTKTWVASEAAEFDTIRFRVNLYRVNSKGQYENILTKPIYINYKAFKYEERWDERYISSHPVEFDLSEHLLVIDSKTLITLEFYTDVPNKVWFQGLLRGPASYHRYTSQGKFFKYSMGLSAGLSVKTRIMKRSYKNS